MIKTILVDDDFLVRSYLKQLSAWEKAGYDIVADVRDGEEALHQMEQTMPEVVVTDISMPLMDGIELIRTIRERKYPVYIVVLSCHDDFQYVKEAMRLGADEYVLKNSLDEESLGDILKNVKSQMKMHREKYQQKTELKRLEQAGRHALKYHFFNGLLSGNLSSEEMEQKRREAGITALYQNSAVVDMFLPDWNALKSRCSALELEQYCQRFQQKLLNVLGETGEEKVSGQTFGELDAGNPGSYAEGVYLGEGIFCCFVDMSNLRRSSLMQQRLTAIAAACFRCCREEEYRFTVGVSGICYGKDGIRQAYQQAREMVKLGFYERDIILYYEESPSIGRDLPDAAQKQLDAARTMQEHRDYGQFQIGFLRAVEAFWENHTESRVVVHWLKELDHRIGAERTLDTYHEIVSIEQIEAFAKTYEEYFSQDVYGQIPDGVSLGVRLAVRYLHEHYREQIGLTDVAGEAGLNSAYLSYLFKQEMGTGFSTYLLELRMECARKLLETTNDKVKDVATRSGFNDYHYFTKAFKKLHGVSPAEYRRQIPLSKNMTQNP